jgi:glutamyl-tRNA reductase
MEAALMVIGLNHRTAPVAMRERFWIGESRRYEAMRQLAHSEGIEEAVVLATCGRTEFLLWASEPTLAANALLHFLSVEHGLKLTEWEHFYRLLDEGALAHIFRVASGLDSMMLSEAEIIAQLQSALEQARAVGASGPFLEAVLEKALNVSRRVRCETAIAQLAVSIPAAVSELAQQIFGSLSKRQVLLLGAGKTSQLCARQLIQSGAASICVINHTLEEAQEVAQELAGTAASMADRWQGLLQADVVISSSGCPHVILTREEAELIARERRHSPLVIIDIAMPRDIDPSVRGVEGILLCDLDGLEQVMKRDAAPRAAAATEAEKIVLAEARAFRSNLQTERAVPTMLALRRRLDEICRQELESFIQERGPFTREQDQALHAITRQVIQKIASSLACELKELPEKEEQERMTAAVQRLFHLETPQAALAGTRLERNEYEQRKNSAVAITH